MKERGNKQVPIAEHLWSNSINRKQVYEGAYGLDDDENERKTSRLILRFSCPQ